MGVSLDEILSFATPLLNLTQNVVDLRTRCYVIRAVSWGCVGRVALTHRGSTRGVGVDVDALLSGHGVKIVIDSGTPIVRTGCARTNSISEIPEGSLHRENVALDRLGATRDILGVSDLLHQPYATFKFLV